MKFTSPPAIILTLSLLLLCGCQMAEGHVEENHAESHEEHHAVQDVVVTSPVEKDVISTQRYVCQIHSRRHIEVCALEGGYLEEIHIKEGQAVKQGDLMFKILPVLYQAKLDSEIAEAQLARIELNNTEQLLADHVVAKPEVALAQAKLAKAEANVALARAELSFTNIKAPFDGIIDRQYHQQGSLIEEGDVLTTLSDNDVMWVYFNMPEARYLEFKTELDNDQADAQDDDHDQEADDDSDDGADADADEQEGHLEEEAEHSHLRIELVLANGETFDQPGKIGAIEADFNNETGNIAFRADFPNPNGLLRNGQTGTILIHRELDDVIVIPQRAVFEILAKRYVYVINEDGVAHQQEIVVKEEKEDIFVVASGLDANDKIVFEGVRQVRDGDKVEYEFQAPEEILSNLKFHAE